MLAMVRDLRIRAREIGDTEWLQREQQKRQGWMWENSLRRHNFVGFVGELVKGVTKAKVREGKYDQWVDEAKAKTRQRVADRAKKGVAADEMDV